MKNRKIGIMWSVLLFLLAFPCAVLALDAMQNEVPVPAQAPIKKTQKKRIEGIASWYAHTRYPNGAATNLFPLGTRVRVTNLKNKKSTVVTITSTWTQKDARRVIDLVSVGFKKIAPLSVGLIRVKIEQLK